MGITGLFSKHLYVSNHKLMNFLTSDQSMNQSINL